MRSMHGNAVRLILPLALAVLGALAAAADQAQRFELRGACYSRAAGALTCIGELTRRECDTHCAEALCDDWFWLERRPCWNWGYGG